MVEIREAATARRVFDTVPGDVRRIGTVVRRGVLLFPVPPALIVGIAGLWNPWNLDVFEGSFLAGGVVPLTIALVLVGIELSLTFRSMLIRLATLALVCICGLFVGLVMFVSDRASAHDNKEENTVARSPDGRIRAVVVNDVASYSIDPTYSLEIHLDRGFDRSTTILSGCEDRADEALRVRFLDNRTLEYAPVKGPPVHVRFDKNLNTHAADRCP